MPMTIRPIEPYNFMLLLDILRRYPAQSTFRVHDDAYWRLLHSGALVRVNVDMDMRDKALRLTCVDGDTSEEIIQEHVQLLLATNTDLSDFYKMARQHKSLWQVIEPLIGLPLMRTGNVYEALIFTIIEQHISWVAANNAQQWLVYAYGDSHTHDGITHHAMPTPQTLAQTTVDDLKPTKITFRRMELIIRVSQQIIAGELELENMLSLTHEAMYHTLLEIKGVGHWTAANVVHRARGVYPYVLHNDVALQKAVGHYFDAEKSSEAVKTVFERYDEYAGLAAHFTLMRYVRDFYDAR